MPRPSGALCRRPAPNSTRGRAWAVIRGYRRDREFSIDDVVDAIDGGSRASLRKWFAALVEDGIIEVVATKNGKACRYHRLSDPGPISPVLRADGKGLTNPNTRPKATRSSQKSRRALAWRQVRAFGQRRQAFRAADVARAISDEPVSVSSIAKYLSALTRTGHVVRVSPGRFRVGSDTGPLSPILRVDGSVHDPNTGKDHEAEA